MGASLSKLNWVRDWERKRGLLAGMGVTLARQGLAYHLIPVSAGKFGRAVAFVKWQALGRSRNSIVFGMQPSNAATPPTFQPIEAVANLYERYLAPLASLGDHRAFTPLSAHGPGCSGSIPARCNIPARRLAPIMWARTGAAAMRSELFNLGDANDAAHAVPCHLCNGPAPLDFYHLAVECLHPVIETWRACCVRSLGSVAPILIEVLRRERDRAGRAPHEELFADTTLAIQNVDFNSSEGDFLTFRFLIAHPWAERMATPGMRGVQLLGRVFDLPGVYHRYERPALDLWCRWSLRWLWRLSHAWREANGLDM